MLRYALSSRSKSIPPPRGCSHAPRFSGDATAEFKASAATASDCEAGMGISPEPARDFGMPLGGLILVEPPPSPSFAEASNVSGLLLCGALAVRMSEDLFK